MRKLIVVLLVMVSSGVASAQYAAPPPQQQPYYGPQPYYAPPQPTQPVQLTVDEQWLLQRGYISPGEHIGGGVVSLMFGFGVGQAVQGRWSEKGYIFTFGEIGSFAVMLWGIQQLATACEYYNENGFDNCNEAKERRGGVLLAGGLIGLSVFRIWEIVDAFTGPADHNRRLGALRGRLGYRDGYALRPFVAPAGDGGGLAGVAMRF